MGVKVSDAKDGSKEPTVVLCDEEWVVNQLRCASLWIQGVAFILRSKVLDLAGSVIAPLFHRCSIFHSSVSFSLEII